MLPESDKWGWKHVSVFGGFDKGSGTKRWKCNHCNLRYNGSYSRVRAHLLGFTGVGVKSCPAIDRSLREALQILEEERLARKKKKSSGVGRPNKRIRTSQSSVTSVQKTITKEDVDDVVARFLYADGLKVNVVNSSYFQEMVKAVSTFGPGYEPPSLSKLSSVFLSKEKGRIGKKMAPIRESWLHTGCTILFVNHVDNKQGCYFNIFVSSPRGLMFLKEVDINDDADNVFVDVLSEAIMEVGPTNFIQIILDLGHANMSSESLIYSKFPHIFWSPCTSNSIRLLLGEIAELDWIKPIVLCAKGIQQCIVTFQRSSPCVCIKTLKESSDPLVTKFAPYYCIVQSIFESKPILQDLIVSEEWKKWKLTVPDVSEEWKKWKLTVPEDIISIEASILGDDFWSRVQLMLQLFEPLLRLLATLNIDKSVMGAVYEWRVKALEAVRSNGIDDIAFKQLEVLIENRWDALFSHLHATGYILNPRYFGKGQSKDKTVMRGWKTTLEIYECESSARRVLREQLSSFWRLEGPLGEEDAVDSRDKMDPVTWWENFGFETPHLQTLAIKVLSQVSSVTSCQEIRQDNDFTSREMFNCLGVERMEDLLFVRNNLGLHRQKF